MDLPKPAKDLADARFNIRPYMASLGAFQTARDIYLGLSGATASIQAIDRDSHVRIVETVISVYDRADWVADLDVLLLYESAVKGSEFVKRSELE